jgi:hypothetical protein
VKCLNLVKFIFPPRELELDEVIILGVEDTQENEKICKIYCGDCPSYPKDSGEWLYCARGKSDTPISREGCLCPGCDIFEKYDLSTTYFCEEGAAE